MLYRLSAITTITLTDLDGAELTAGSVTELLEPTGAYSADDLRSSDVLESAITGGTAILFGPNNRTLSSIKSTGVGNIVGLDSDDLDITSLNADLIQSGGTDLYNIFVTDVGPNDITRVQPGLNITTGGTPNFPIINLADNVEALSLSASTVSGGTFIGDGSGITNLSIPPRQECVVVAKSGATYSSINTALDDITDASANKPYSIKVCPGVYVEDTIVMKPYVNIIGYNDATIIEVDSTSKDCVVLTGNSELRNVHLRGSTDNGKATLAIQGSFGPGVSAGVDNITIGTTDHVFKSSLGLGQFCVVAMKNVVTNANSDFNTGYSLSGNGNTVLSISNSKSSVNVAADNYVFVAGSGNRLVLTDFAVLVQGSLGGSLSNFITIYDGATLDATAVGIDGAGTTIRNENNGSAAKIRCNAFNIVNSTANDLDILHPSTSGHFVGTATESKVNIESTNEDFSLSYSDPTGGFVITGELSLGDVASDVAPISDLIRYGTTIGLYSGGTISHNSGLDIDVSSGYGYLNDPLSSGPRVVNWVSSGLTMPSNSIRYIFVNENGVVSSQANQPNTKTRITLGRVISDGSSIVSINNTPITGRNYQGDLEDYRRAILRTTYNSGSIVSENTTDRKLDVTGGVFYFSNNKISPSGGDAITFTPVYQSSTSGQWIYSSTGDTVPNDKYDDGSGTLASLSASSWVKHSVYVNGEGDDEKYFLLYGQEMFGTQTAAENGNSPTAPDGWTEGIAILADIIIQASGSSITEVVDRRNFLGTGAASGGGGGVTDHGELTGLADDDHTQYLLGDGSRAMTGILDMGGNQITNVGDVDGVDVSAHASRHLPNGADPLSTGAPSTIGTSNTEGTANAFARQDHVHSHGNQGGGSLHSDATTSTSGFLSAADKLFLDSVPSIFDTKANLSGATFSGNIFAPEVTGNTLYSGDTELSEVVDDQISAAIAGISVPAFDGYDSAGGLVSVTTAWSAPIPLNTQRKITSEFSHSTTVSNSEVTINETDTYFVFGRVSTQASGSNSRTQGECRLELDVGGIGSWASVPGTTAEMYLRQLNFGATGTFFAALDLTAGDKLRMNMRRQNGGASVTTQAGGSSLIVLKAKGPKGDKGDTGTSTGITHDRQSVYLTATTNTTSTTPVDLNGMSITTKDLGGPATYDISFTASRSNSTSNLLNLFYINVDGVNVRQTRVRTYTNEIHTTVLSASIPNISSGTVIKIQYDAQAGGTHSVFERTMTIDGVLDANVKQ